MKSKKTSLILCAVGFLGLGGLHDFYLDEIGRGLIKLFTCNWFLIGTIVDFIRIATDSYDARLGDNTVIVSNNNYNDNEIYVFHCIYCDNIVKKTDDFCSKCGKKIRFLTESDLEVEREFNSIDNIDEIDDLEGLEFEKYVGELLKKLNYKDVKVTKASNDYGIDILCEKDNIKYAIQCKNYSSPLGNKCVQEAYSGKQYYNCHVGVVVTNNYFTENAKKLANKNGILLWDRTTLKDMIKEANK